MNTVENRLAAWIVAHPRWILITTLLFTLAASSGLLLLGFDQDLRIFFSKDNPQFQTMEKLEHTYIKFDNVLFVLAPHDGTVFTQDTLAAIKEVTTRAWDIPYSTRVDSLSNFQDAWTDNDVLFVQDLVVNPETMSQKEIERIRTVALSEPLLVDHAISSAGHTTGIMVSVNLPGIAKDEVSEVVKFTHTLVEEIEKKYSHIKIVLAGWIIWDHAYGEVSKDDLTTLTPIMMGIIGFVAYWLLRSFIGALLTLFIVILSVMTVMGLAGWMGMTINPASACAPTIILTLAVADSIHILTTIFHAMRSGESKAVAILKSVSVNIKPIFITSLTTSIGFLSLNFSDAPPFRDLGNIVAIGGIASFGYAAFSLPALLSFLSVTTPAQSTANEPLFDRFANLVITYHSPIFWISLLMSILIMTGILRNELNDDWVKYFGKSYDVRIAADYISENLTGIHDLDYSLETGISGGIHDPTYLKIVEKFAQWYRSQPKVVHVRTINETIKRLNKVMHENREEFYRIPKSRDLVAQYLLLYELSLPFGRDLNTQINLDKSATRMTASLRGATTKDFRDLEERAQTWLAANASNLITAEGTGLSMIWAYISEKNIKSMIGASIGALALVSAILIMAFRSFKLGMISLVPNLIPAFVAFGVWGVLVGQIGLGLSVVVSLTLGIVVNDTVHFLTQYHHALQKERLDSRDAIRYAFHTVGVALTITSIILIAGFLVLTLSGYKMNSDMGLMSALTILFAFILDFLLLPTLLIKVDG